MRNNRTTVFLSCSEKFKEEIATPIKLELSKLGIDAIIASDEPIPNNANWDPEAKIEKLLEQSDCSIVLATPDDESHGGSYSIRNNVSDEVGRMRSMPHLRNRILVLKETSVVLPSNINPTHESLDLADPIAAIPQILRQMKEWHVIEEPLMHAAEVHDSTSAREPVAELIDGLRFADYEGAQARAFKLALESNRDQLGKSVASLAEFVLASSSDSEDFYVATALIEALARIDETLLTAVNLERFATSSDFALRSCAANLLWDLALTKPGDVPLGLLGRLICPSNEDWYVFSPAMAAAKELLLVRAQTRSVFEHLLHSENAEDRRAAAVALIEVARIDPSVVPPQYASTLAGDPDEDVAGQGAVLQMVLLGAGSRNFRIGNFGL
jgi:hypothetical protein